MKLKYLENPLSTKVWLTEEEKQKLKEGIQKDCEKEDEYQTRLGLHLLHADKIYNACLEALLGPHHGDCICAPSTCLKCYAEDFLGTCTLPSKDSLTNNGIHRGYQVHKTTELCLKNLTPETTLKAIEEHADKKRRSDSTS